MKNTEVYNCHNATQLNLLDFPRLWKTSFKFLANGNKTVFLLGLWSLKGVLLKSVQAPSTRLFRAPLSQKKAVIFSLNANLSYGLCFLCNHGHIVRVSCLIIITVINNKLLRWGAILNSDKYVLLSSISFVNSYMERSVSSNSTRILGEPRIVFTKPPTI